MPAKAIRGALLHCLADPREVGPQAAHQYLADGLLLVDDGRIEAFGEAATLLPTLPPGTELIEYPDALIVPGFVDTHVHYPQLAVIGAYGTQLLDWLNSYTFPAEARFADPAHAERQAKLFLDELLRNGTTTAAVFCTVHAHSVDAFFTEALGRNLRMIAGKVLMDRHAPTALCDTAQSGDADSRALIERWHGKGRLHYAITPRFAATSTPEQLRLAGELFREIPGLYLHTHLSENNAEIDWVRQLFPERAHYLDVYDHHGLTGPRAVFAHGIHLCDDECRRLADSGSAVAFCPSSNLFLGSGLLDLARLEGFGVRVGLGSDIGAGTSLSALQTLNEAYKVLQLQGQSLDPFKALYLATLGGARALYLDDCLGNFLPGKDADFAVLDLAATPLLAQRMASATTLAERLFALMILGDDRAVQATYAVGECVHRR